MVIVVEGSEVVPWYAVVSGKLCWCWKLEGAFAVQVMVR